MHGSCRVRRRFWFDGRARRRGRVEGRVRDLGAGRHAHRGRDGDGRDALLAAGAGSGSRGLIDRALDAVARREERVEALDQGRVSPEQSRDLRGRVADEHRGSEPRWRKLTRSMTPGVSMP